MNAEELAGIEEKWLQQCGPCDGGLPMSCTHPTEDYRPVISDLLAAVRERDNTIARVRDIVESVHQSDGLDPDGYQVAGLIRAALDPQEKP